MLGDSSDRDMDTPQLPQPVFPPARTPPMVDHNDLTYIADQLLAHETMCSVPRQCHSRDDWPIIMQHPLRQTRPVQRT